MFGSWEMTSGGGGGVAGGRWGLERGSDIIEVTSHVEMQTIFLSRLQNRSVGNLNMLDTVMEPLSVSTSDPLSKLDIEHAIILRGLPNSTGLSPRH